MERVRLCTMLVMARWQANRTKCPANTHVLPKSPSKLFFLNDRPLSRYWLTVCTRLAKIHLKAIQRGCVRQEACVLAVRVIHSVTCTQRGPSSLVSLLLAFKECPCVYNVHAMRERVYFRELSCMHTSLLEHLIIPLGHTCASYCTAWPVTTGSCQVQVQARILNRYCYREVTVIAPHMFFFSSHCLGLSEI